MPSTKRVQVKDRLPPNGKWVIAVTPTYRCLAYVDERGKWRDVARSREIPDVQEWCVDEEERMP